MRPEYFFFGFIGLLLNTLLAMMIIAVSGNERHLEEVPKEFVGIKLEYNWQIFAFYVLLYLWPVYLVVQFLFWVTRKRGEK